MGPNKAAEVLALWYIPAMELAGPQPNNTSPTHHRQDERERACSPTTGWEGSPQRESLRPWPGNPAHRCYRAETGPPPAGRVPHHHVAQDSQSCLQSHPDTTSTPTEATRRTWTSFIGSHQTATLPSPPHPRVESEETAKTEEGLGKTQSS